MSSALSPIIVEDRVESKVVYSNYWQARQKGSDLLRARLPRPEQSTGLELIFRKPPSSAIVFESHVANLTMMPSALDITAAERMLRETQQAAWGIQFHGVGVKECYSSGTVKILSAVEQLRMLSGRLRDVVEWVSREGEADNPKFVQWFKDLLLDQESVLEVKFNPVPNLSIPVWSTFDLMKEEYVDDDIIRALIQCFLSNEMKRNWTSLTFISLVLLNY